MQNYRQVAADTFWIGASDRRISRFENLFPLTHGVSYNSYLVTDEKTVLFDTADISVSDQFLENLAAALAGRALDYIVVLHMEPDHCATLATVAKLYPGATLIGGMKTFTFMDQFFPELKALPRKVVKEGEMLETGSHTFRFVAAPMVHWPEVMMAYDTATKSLFSADAFGTFGAVDGGIFMDEHDYEKEYLADARRYYANIVGKYGQQVQAVLKKAAGLEIENIFSLHGPVWRKDLGVLLEKYQLWSTYTAEEDDIVLIYGSLYGHTASAAEACAARLRARTGRKVFVYDVSETHVSYLVSEIWRCANIVLFSPTYNNGLYPPVEALLHDLEALGVKNRRFALAENGSWAPVAGKLMRAHLEALKNCTVLEDTLTIKSALHDEAALDAFVEKIAEMIG